MPRRKPEPTPPKDTLGMSDKRGGYSGGADAETVPPPEKTPSAYRPVTKNTGR
jgi:hypothetical protein